MPPFVWNLQKKTTPQIDLCLLSGAYELLAGSVFNGSFAQPFQAPRNSFEFQLVRVCRFLPKPQLGVSLYQILYGYSSIVI